MTRRSRSLLELVLEDIDRRIGFLQQERLNVLQLHAAHQTRAKPTPTTATKPRRQAIEDVTARNIPRLEQREQ